MASRKDIKTEGPVKSQYGRDDPRLSPLVDHGKRALMYPKTYFNVVLVDPEIPQNTGNIGRTCVGTYCKLHLVGKLGFKITDRELRRSGLDYWPHLDWVHHPTWDDWWRLVTDPSRVFFFETKKAKDLYDQQLKLGDWLVFGRETKGFDAWVLEKFAEQMVTIPILGPIRSLNLATAVAVVVYEGLRQTNSLNLVDMGN